MSSYAELQVTSNFSFLRGASHPEELVERAHALGLAGIALTDRNSFAGLVRAHVKAKELGVRFLPGVRLDLEDAPSLLCWPGDRAAYARLSTLLTLGKRRAPKGRCRLRLADVLAHDEGQLFAILPPDGPEAVFRERLRDLARRWRGRLWLVVHHLYRGDDAARIERLAGIAAEVRVPLLATNDVHYHRPERRRLQDILTCIREHCTIDEAGGRLFAHAERHLKTPAEMARLFAGYPEALAAGPEILERCRFSLDQLAYDYPVRTGEQGRTPQEELEHRVREGIRERYGGDAPSKVEAQIRHELALIAELGYAPYFLTVHDIVRFARSRGILCQGRGSAANSAVCFVLGITSVDPARMDLLFERFVSAERGEPPDIDVDFEHERREEVIRHIYETYGRDHAALAATVIRYRTRSALRDVGKAMGLSADTLDALSRTVWGVERRPLDPARLREVGLDPGDRRLRTALELAAELLDFPRHLSQHVGGFVIARSPLHELVPIENAAMEGRTVVEWDKDDLEALGMLKIDILALGMLSCIRRAFELLERHYGIAMDLARVPAEDPAVYAMLCEGDAIGVFQVESRAQMAMLPRLRPRCFYDLVIEVAIVRPGPIQGDMVHPYLRRRRGEEPVSCPSKELEAVLGRTLGVPLFQEQAMKIAMVAAGFTAAEADGLRRAMAAFRRRGALDRYRTRFLEGMTARGYDREFAERCFRQIEGFGYYGFPESHAASFAHLVYVSAWLKCHWPDVFCAAILDAQPMGFYAPAQLVRDAREHGVEVRPVDVSHSFWECTLEPLPCRRGPLKTAVRLGFRMVKGFAEEDARRLVAARTRPWRDVADLYRRSGLSRAALERLAEADAFASLGLDRRRALWAVRGLAEVPLPLFDHAEEGREGGSGASLPEGGGDPRSGPPAASTGEEVVEDYARLRLSLRAHPLALLRASLRRRGVVTARGLREKAPGERVTTAGLVIVRQRPGSAKGVIFLTLEDETGFANLVVWARVFEAFRPALMAARLLAARGRIQREGRVLHLVAERLFDWTPMLARLVEAETGSEPAAAATIARKLPEGRNFK